MSGALCGYPVLSETAYSNADGTRWATCRSVAACGKPAPILVGGPIVLGIVTLRRVPSCRLHVEAFERHAGTGVPLTATFELVPTMDPAS